MIFQNQNEINEWDFWILRLSYCQPLIQQKPHNLFSMFQVFLAGLSCSSFWNQCYIRRKGVCLIGIVYHTRYLSFSCHKIIHIELFFEDLNPLVPNKDTQTHLQKPTSTINSQLNNAVWTDISGFNHFFKKFFHPFVIHNCF